MSARPAWALGEAAQHCGVSRSTLKRRLAAGDLPNAYKTPEGQWRIPVPDLLAAGYQPGAPDWGDAQPATQDEPAPVLGRVAELERELALERARRANAEQIAEERRGRIEDLQMAMRLLEAPRSTSGPTGPDPRSTDLGHEPPPGPSGLGQDALPQITGSSSEPTPGPSDLGQGGPPEPPHRSWWARLVGK